MRGGFRNCARATLLKVAIRELALARVCCVKAASLGWCIYRGTLRACKTVFFE